MTINKTANRRFKTALFDLDDCLYRVERAPFLVKRNIERKEAAFALACSLCAFEHQLRLPTSAIALRSGAGFMVEKLGVPEDQAKAMCLDCYINYGTTLAGLVV